MIATMKLHRRLRVTAAFACALTLAACASAPLAPTASLQAAQQAISNAERDDAGRYASGELSEARTKLAAADAAVIERKMLAAERFADQSRVNAELASARAAAVKAKTVNEEMKRSTAALIEEMRRNSGGTL